MRSVVLECRMHRGHDKLVEEMLEKMKSRMHVPLDRRRLAHHFMAFAERQGDAVTVSRWQDLMKGEFVSFENESEVRRRLKKNVSEHNVSAF